MEFGKLTQRQMQIIALFCEGLNKPQAAKKLFLSESTINNDLYFARQEMKCTTTAQLCYKFGIWISMKSDDILKAVTLKKPENEWLFLGEET
jgi:DNA-binding CsgD family transcriptional regulator